MTLSPALGFLGLFKIALNVATPLLVGIAGVILFKHRLVAGRCLLVAAALILLGVVGPMFAPETLRSTGVNLMSLICSSGWFVAGVTLVFLGINHRSQESGQQVATESRR
ncbi:MAG: hypothetical protein AB8C46_00045 [Burkholderiaceae bacterium]